MPDNTAAIRSFWIAGDATYEGCEISWNTASHAFIVYDPLLFRPPIIQESFRSIQKVLHESVSPSCLTLVLNLKWIPEEKSVKSPRLIFLFNDVSSAIEFHKVLLPLDRDYVKNTTGCSCRESLGSQKIEASPRAGDKRAHDEDDEEPATKRYRPAFFTTLKIAPHLQPRLAELLAKTPQPAVTVHKAQACNDDEVEEEEEDQEDTIVIGTPLGPNRRHVWPPLRPFRFVEEFVEVREENGKMKLEKRELQEKIVGLQGQVAVARAEQSLAATQLTQLQADIQLLKDLVGRITRPLIQLDVDGYLTRIKWGEDPDAAIKNSHLYCWGSWMKNDGDDAAPKVTIE
ncbi:hypothetical protein EDD37DRAFT_607855 [Exophiala viscosa]|uniref:Uncharacterized protein n=1 Tax=Exophiala viscosa TaxID=2486360 RepID=A0AAN6ID84_9EURO|nr:hypothetical protein EDD36DRAFT_419355 [Exophiala viscosa]KAI1626283.1 hypothetical protein EDD37DRAFT_607855 [Exophiala viscosa]